MSGATEIRSLSFSNTDMHLEFDLVKQEAWPKQPEIGENNKADDLP